MLVSPVARSAYGPEGMVMSIFIVVGASMSAYGAAYERWTGEFSGLPLLIAALPVLGLLTARGLWDISPWLAMGHVLMLFGVAAYATARFRVVWAVYKMVHHVNNAVSREG